MSRRLIREGLKALREANQDHIPQQYFGPPTKATFTMPSNHDMNPSMPRDEINALMNNMGGNDPIIPRNLRLKNMKHRFQDTEIKAPKSTDFSRFELNLPKKTP